MTFKQYPKKRQENISIKEKIPLSITSNFMKKILAGVISPNPTVEIIVEAK